MKFIELKKSLSKLSPIYLISGEDRFLCYNALNQIINATKIELPDLNYVTLNAATADDIVAACNMYPFADAYRLVVVQDYNPKAGSAAEQKIIEKYISNPMNTTILVFFNLQEDSFFKNLKTKISYVDCSKLDQSSINAYITQAFNRAAVQYSPNVPNLIALQCNYDMQRISGELDKLIAYSAGKEKLDENVIKNLVTQEKEYQIFELAEYIAKNDAAKALDLVASLSGKGGFAILVPLYNNYRRALYVSISGGDAELATSLGIKEFAVKMLRNQTRVFSPKKLKQIVDLLEKTDADIKKGKQKEDVAVKTIITDILKIRNS
jgi:DNA polymerase-3 subunit delta